MLLKNANACYTSVMEKRKSPIDRRLEEIERKRQELLNEEAMLLKLRVRLHASSGLLKPDDRFTEKTKFKYELLGYISEYLNRRDPYLFGGASTREIYEEILKMIERDNQKNLHQNEGLSEVESEDSILPESSIKKMKNGINYNTFRTYLMRFKNEGRIRFDTKSKRWSIRNS